MNRRTFLSNSAIVTVGSFTSGKLRLFPGSPVPPDATGNKPGLYELFVNPELKYHPYVRWWWNGDKVEPGEIIRELRLLKEAGIGGVEINPIEFPARSEGDDLGKPSLIWLSNEWIDMLRVAFDEAIRLGLTCDLIVGSGWPFGSENLGDDERAQIVVIGVKKLAGPQVYEISEYELFREADPPVSSPFPGRTMQLVSLKLVPDPLDDIDKVTDLSDQCGKSAFRIDIPQGKWALYALVRINGFMKVIDGAPGATGPVLDHFNPAAVRKYLTVMSSVIENRIGPLSGYIRALFTDSMELEGSNWSDGIMDEFRKRRGYDIWPYLPFVLFRTGAMGNVTDFRYGVNLTTRFDSMIRRMRYDFEVTKAELLKERFIDTYTGWCRSLNVKSRAQAYGRGFFPLESSFSYDIPECESWTMNWLKHKVGEEMPEEDYRRGRAYTMINKYVSSAANLTGKRLVSCEEMTDTYTVFNTSLENLKIGGDQSAITGVTHSIFHGFNYSPPEAPYPGWIRYGAYYNEKNTWWPWFHLYNEYKARLSSLLQHVTMFTDIAILPPVEDMWGSIGAQMEPFPSITNVEYLSLVWEAINKNGSGCDYVSQRVITDASVRDGYLIYGPKRYGTLFLVQVDSLTTAAASRLLEFVESGGRIFCIETIPSQSLGWKDNESRDITVRDLVDKMKSFPERFIFLKKPEKDFISWYGGIQKQYGLDPYLKIENPDPYVYQNRYRADDGTEMLFIINSHINNSHKSRITFSKEMTRGKYGWIWDPETGKRYRITLQDDNSLELDMGPADSFLFIFDRERKGPEWQPLAASGNNPVELKNGWSAEFIHCHDGTVRKADLDLLRDLKDMTDYVNFAGIVVYRNSFRNDGRKKIILNLGKVYGLSALKVNGKECGVRWYGRRIFDISGYTVEGENTIEISVATSMGNYMKSLTDNRIAQYWTNEKTKVQPLQSMGLTGPVTIYS